MDYTDKQIDDMRQAIAKWRQETDDITELKYAVGKVVDLVAKRLSDEAFAGFWPRIAHIQFPAGELDDLNIARLEEIVANHEQEQS